MEFYRVPLFLLLVLLFSLLQTPTIAIKKSYVVYMGAHSHGPEISPADLELVEYSHHNFLGSFLGSTKKAKDAIFYSYTRYINGFAATLEEEEAAEIAKDPRVVSVFPNRARQLHTTRSWEFLGQEKNGVVEPGSIWEKARFGEDTIIGNLDTGVWPESKSFSEDRYGPIPSKWKGICVHNDGVHCNRKLIGARYYNKGFAAAAGPLNSSFESARDQEGHGTHTLSTAGGNFVHNASVNGIGNGTAKGGSSRARVAAYKVCWPEANNSSGGCFDADILSAFEDAIHDGVHVISLSVGGDPINYYLDPIAIGSFHAVQNGIVVVSSAGNSGPTDGSVSNVSPWLLTVGASTLDREFTSYVEFGHNQKLKGQSLSPDSLKKKKYPLFKGDGEDAQLCIAGSLDPKRVKGKIVVCLRGQNARKDKGEVVLKAGGVGMILANDELSGNDLIADVHVLPASHITYKDSLPLYAYINSTKAPLAYITRSTTQLGTKPAPLMAAFSSKGPNTVTPEILKPDITAPGVNVIAAYAGSTVKSGQSYDSGVYITESGTSMSCPHISGVVGLLKTLYPDWSPSAIKSAIITTAGTRDNAMQPLQNSSYLRATPFSYGGGHVRPNRAMDPGLVYDLTIADYLNFLCAIGYDTTKISNFTDSDKPYRCPKNASVLDLNYPSITVPSLSGSTTLKRTVKNVGSPATYKVLIRAPPGISVSVEPESLKFDKVGEEKTFRVTLKTKQPGAAKDYVFGHFIWSDGHHIVRSRIVVKAAAAA